MAPSATEKDPTVICQLRLRLPSSRYCNILTGSHPDLGMEITSLLPTGRGQMVESLRITGAFDPSAIHEELRQCPLVHSVERASASNGEATFTISSPICPLLSSLQDLGIPPSVPFVIRDGYKHVLVAASVSKVRELYRRLREHYPEVVVQSIRNSVLVGKRSLLTGSQNRVFSTALSAGYWDVPRKVTMSELASQMKLSRSRMSEILATIEHKLLYEVRSNLLRTLH